MKLLFLSTILFGMSLSLSAQNINSLFVAMPDSLSPLLTKVNRQDFADFLSSGMKAVVKNKFGGESEMQKLTDDYIMLKTTDSSVEEMKMLPLNDSVKIICVVKTYSGPVEDSKVEFYSTDWKKLSCEDFIKLPSLEDFFVKEKDKLPKFRDMFLYKAELSEKCNGIIFTFCSPDATDKETSDKMSGCIKKNLEYTWVNGRYEVKQ